MQTNVEESGGLKTYHFEMGFVALVLFLVVFFLKNTPLEYVGALAVLFSFGHASIAERFREREEAKANPGVSCFQKSLHYFLAKEVCWSVYFLGTGCYSALVGVVVFLLYPVWRKVWRSYKPLTTEKETRYSGMIESI